LDASERFMRELGTLFEKQEAAETFIDRELARIVPKLEWVIPYLFQGRRIGYIGEPHLVPGLHELVRMLGAHLSSVILTNRPHHAKAIPESLRGPDLLVFPKMKGMMEYLERQQGCDELNLLISHNMGITTDTPTLEFGFPSLFRHSLYERPFLGFEGAIAFIEDMANAMRMREAEVAMRQIRSSGLGQLMG
ncbi:MAG: nitrogenase component 1, partial [Myxococcales bacterium]|nr:nitrogenase component 1 [Myxococcales bacterium]